MTKKTVPFDDFDKKNIYREIETVEKITRHWVCQLENPVVKQEQIFEMRDRIKFRKNHPLLQNIDQATVLMENSYYLACSGRFYGANLLIRTWYEILIKGIYLEMGLNDPEVLNKSKFGLMLSQIFSTIIKERFKHFKNPPSGKIIWRIINPFGKYKKKKFLTRIRKALKLDPNENLDWILADFLKDAHDMYIFYGSLSKFTHGKYKSNKLFYKPEENNLQKFMAWEKRFMRATELFQIVINKPEFDSFI